MLIDEPDTETNALHDRMYSKAAELFANELYDQLTQQLTREKGNSILNAVKCDMQKNGKRDINCLLWALIPYISALSGEKDMENTVSFGEAATPRPDWAVISAPPL